jgi:prepilin-type N-terminal cleavage/methylation domain-containing protein
MMKPANLDNARGFSLVELMVAMAIGLVIMGAATQLFKSGMDATQLVTEQAEMQQNVRGALNLVARDVSMAGSGLPMGGIALPYGTGALASHYARNQTPKSYLTSVNYPSGPVGNTTVSNYMFGLIPGPVNGMELGGATTIAATNATADAITLIYVDYSFPLSQYSVVLAGSNTSMTLTQPATPPAGFPAIVSPTGIVIGDLIMLSNSNGTTVVEVTGVTATAGGGGTVTFANGDPLAVNQTGAASGNVSNALGGGGNIQANRLLAVTYFIEVPTVAGQTPRLMRQVNGQTAVPVADNIIGLNFTYDACDSVNNGSGIACAGLKDPIGNSPSFSPNQIHKVNIQMMGQAVLVGGNRSRSMALVTSVSTRNLSYTNRYN